MNKGLFRRAAVSMATRSGDWRIPRCVDTRPPVYAAVLTVLSVNRPRRAKKIAR